MDHGNAPLPDTVRGRNGVGPDSEDTQRYATNRSIATDSVHICRPHSVRRAVHKPGCQRHAAAHMRGHCQKLSGSDYSDCKNAAYNNRFIRMATSLEIIRAGHMQVWLFYDIDVAKRQWMAGRKLGARGLGMLTAGVQRKQPSQQRIGM